MQDIQKPLAEILRPTKLTDFIGQKHLLGKTGAIAKMLKNKQAFSSIFWGPPGTGKTSLAYVLAKNLGLEIGIFSAVSAGKKDLSTFIIPTNLSDKNNEYDHNLYTDKKNINFGINNTKLLFLDEIHRFNKAQQDFLLPFVESGKIILIGATTENPSFEINNALLSRVQVFVFKPLEVNELSKLAKKACEYLQITLENNAIKFLSEFATGDGRKILNLLQFIKQQNNGDKNKQNKIKLSSIKELIGKKFIQYDKNGDQHYNIISAFIKSMRASDPDASLYYLARMVNAGEDPKFIARRMIIFASEDIGMSQPTALVVANAVFSAVEKIGYPEAQINLAHGVVYLTLAKKDRSAHDAYFKALDDVAKYADLPIPLDLRNAPTKLMQELGYGENYQKYSQKSHLPKKLFNKKYYKLKD